MHFEPFERFTREGIAPFIEAALAAPLTRLKRSSASKLCDMMTSGVVAFVVSDRFVSVLESVSATGWRTARLELVLGRERVEYGYSLLIVDGACGAIQRCQRRVDFR